MTERFDRAVLDVADRLARYRRLRSALAGLIGSDRGARARRSGSARRAGWPPRHRR